MHSSIWTVGHSTLSWPDFLQLLLGAGVGTVADVRRYPASRRHPQFEARSMARALADAGLAYVHFEALGGRRQPRPDSPNLAWRNAGFRGYADYMATPAYAAARDALEVLAIDGPTAVLCAEALWWQCHRGLLADDLKSRGWEVRHLLPGRASVSHPYTAAARLIDGRLDYAGTGPAQPGLF